MSCTKHTQHTSRHHRVVTQTASLAFLVGALFALNSAQSQAAPAYNDFVVCGKNGCRQGNTISRRPTAGKTCLSNSRGWYDTGKKVVPNSHYVCR
jgi:hypothetical protein